MFDIILRYLYGFAKIHLRGIHINRFVNLCKARDIKLWDLEQKEDETFLLKITDVKDTTITSLTFPEEYDGYPVQFAEIR